MSRCTRHPWLALVALVACATATPRPTSWGDPTAAQGPSLTVAHLKARLLGRAGPPFPSDDTRTDLHREGRGPLEVGVRVCVADTGALTRLEVVAPSDWPDLDADAIDTLRGTRYGPGPAGCAVLVLHYRQL